MADKLKICFPMVWNALFYKRTTTLKKGDGGQVQAINIVFSSYLDPASPNDKSNVTNWIRGGKPFAKELAQRLFSFEQNEIDTIADNIKELGINPIRNIVSAFHHYLKENNVVVGSADKRAMEEALRQDDPELYIARALLAGLRCREEQEALTKEEIDKLRNLETQTDYPDAFAEIDNAQTGVSVPSDVTGDSLKLLWQKVEERQTKTPEAVSLRTLRKLEEISEEEAEGILSSTRYLLDRGGKGLFRRCFGSQPELMFLSVNDAHRITYYSKAEENSPERLFDCLEECGLIISAPFEYEVNNKRSTCLFATVGDDLAIDIKPTRDMNNVFNVMIAEGRPTVYKCYNLTRAGQELFSCLDLRTDRDYFLALAGKLKSEYRDLSLEVYEYYRDDKEIRIITIDLDKQEVNPENQG